MTRIISIVLVAMAGSLLACSNGRAHRSGSASAIDPAAQKQADDIFVNRCTPCHGSAGRGDGPASASLSPHPRNFTDHSWQVAVADEHLQKIIQYGGAAVGKSPNMPANPDLQDKPAVIQALVGKIRGFGRN